MPLKAYKKYFDLPLLIKEIRDYLGDFNEEKILEAFDFAEKAHQEQMRKDGTTPYIAHPVEVMKILASMKADEDVLIAALLHDVPEDTEYSLKDVEKCFGPKVAFLVDGVTKLTDVYRQQALSKQGRAIESLKKLFLHGIKDPRVILIKLADRLHNMRTLEHVKENRRAQIANETLEIYVPTASLLGVRKMRRDLEDLCFKYLQPEIYQELVSKIENEMLITEEKTRKLITNIEESLSDLKVDLNFEIKPVGIYRTHLSLKKSHKKIEKFNFVPTVKILMDDIQSCYQVLGMVHSRYKPKEQAFHDHIANPEVDGRQVLKTSVFGVDGVLTKILITTKKLDLESELGIAAKIFVNFNEEFVDKRSKLFSQIEELGGHADDQKFLSSLKKDILIDRIVVFNDRGETYDLPSCARIIDFAYAQSDQLGHHSIGAYVNGSFKVISEGLKTGDMVEIITDQKVSPSIRWLTFAQTKHAKSKIKSYLKDRSKEKRVKEGKKILQKELDLVGLGHYGDLNLKRVVKDLSDQEGGKFENWNEIFLALGNGDLEAIEVVRLFQEKALELKKNDEEKTRQLMWLKIKAKNRFGLIGDIMSCFYKHSFEVIGIRANISEFDEECAISVHFRGEDLETVLELILELEEMPDVMSVSRVFDKALLVSMGLTLNTISLFILVFLGQKAILDIIYFGIGYSNRHGAIYFGILALAFLNVLLYKKIKVYYPSTRKMTAPLLFFKWLPVCLIIFLFSELLIYFVKPLFLSLPG